MSESCDARAGCMTCGDVAIEMAVVTLDEALGLAQCEDADGGRQSVEIALAAPVSIGDRLLVHAGTAIAHAAEAIR
jgi:hydrogenase maturation factor